MKNSTCIDSASLRQERMLKYKTFSVAFSYPDDNFFSFFPILISEKEKLHLEYDRLFRSNGIWLYSTEYTAENEFQRARGLADISGFYKAFGLEPNKDRPDALASELEFMHYLIYKELNAPDKEKALICFSAQKKFFAEHLLPSAKKMAQTIIAQGKNNFYKGCAQDMLIFLESEEIFLKGKKQ